MTLDSHHTCSFLMLLMVTFPGRMSDSFGAFEHSPVLVHCYLLSSSLSLLHVSLVVHHHCHLYFHFLCLVCPALLGVVAWFVGGGGAPLSVLMCHGVWPSSLSWWWCHCWCHIIILHHFHVLSLHVSLLSCVPHHCHVSSPCCCPVWLSLLCPPCDMLVPCCHSSFGCHVTVGNVAPGFCVEDMIGRGEVSLLTLAHHCLWLYVGAGHHSQAMVDGHGRFWVHLCMWAPGFVCGWLASFLGSCGGGEDMGCHWHQVLCCGCCWWHHWFVVCGWLKK